MAKSDEGCVCVANCSSKDNATYVLKYFEASYTYIRTFAFHQIRRKKKMGNQRMKGSNDGVRRERDRNKDSSCKASNTLGFFVFLFLSHLLVIGTSVFN